MKDPTKRKRASLNKEIDMALNNNKTDLPVCKHCGWQMAGFHEERTHEATCTRAAAGKQAVALAARFPEIEATQHGYGTGVLVFEIDKDYNIKLGCHADGFYIEDVWLLGELSPDAAADFVQTLAAWRARHPPKTS